MDKQKLKTFIEKYALGGNIETVLWNIEHGKLRVEFISDDKAAKGTVVLNSFDGVDENKVMGVYSTSQFSKLLSILNESFKMEIIEKNNKNVAVIMNDGFTTAKYALCEESAVPDVPELQYEPKYEIEISVDENLINLFTKSASALSGDSDSFTVRSAGDIVDIIIGNASEKINSSNIKFSVKPDKISEISDVSFRSLFFNEALKANKGIVGNLTISSEGFAKLTFKDNDYLTTYLFVGLEEE